MNVSARYIDKRYSTFTNEEHIGGYTLFNAYIDLGGGFDAGPLKQIKARLNVDNLLDRNYLGNIFAVPSGGGFFRPGPDRTVQFTLTATL